MFTKLQVDLKKLVGLGVDGCSTMLSEKKGLATRMKETSPSLISFHYPAHWIQLILKIFLKIYIF